MDGFKQRIFGALIIVSLAVIFLPMMFDEPHEERTSRAIDIPAQPDSPGTRIDAPREPEPVDEPEPPASVDAPDPAQPEARTEVDPAPQETAPEERPEPESDAIAQQTEPQAEEQVPDSAALEGSYLVQLASFGSSDNARRFRDQARNAGFEAYVEEFSRDGDRYHRVFSGPFVDRDAAESAKSDLDDALGIEGLVVAAGE